MPHAKSEPSWDLPDSESVSRESDRHRDGRRHDLMTITTGRRRQGSLNSGIDITPGARTNIHHGRRDRVGVATVAVIATGRSTRRDTRAIGTYLTARSASIHATTLGRPTYGLA